MLRGLPPWATDCRSSEYAARLERLLDDWRPDVVEIHLQAMAQYVAAATASNVPRILVDYDPPSAWAQDVFAMTTGPRRLARKVEVGAWRRYERATRPRFDAIVVFAERDVAAVQPIGRQRARDLDSARSRGSRVVPSTPSEPIRRRSCSSERSHIRRTSMPLFGSHERSFRGCSSASPTRGSTRRT